MEFFAHKGVVKMLSVSQKTDIKRRWKISSSCRRIVVQTTIVACLVLVTFGLLSLAKEYRTFLDYELVHGSRFLRLRCETCALVTNSGHTIGSYLGSQIDRNECVFRLNGAPTKDFEDDVGTRTTIQIIAAEILTTNSTALTKTSFGKATILYSKSIKSVKFSELEIFQSLQESMLLQNVFVIPNTKLRQMDKTFLYYAESNPNRAINITIRPTTAFVGFLIAIDICQKLEIYGVTQPYHCDKYRHAYDAPLNYFPPGNEIPGCVETGISEKLHLRTNLLTEETVAIQKLTSGIKEIKFFAPTWYDGLDKRKL